MFHFVWIYSGGTYTCQRICRLNTLQLAVSILGSLLPKTSWRLEVQSQSRHYAEHGAPRPRRCELLWATGLVELSRGAEQASDAFSTSRLHYRRGALLDADLHATWNAVASLCMWSLPMWLGHSQIKRVDFGNAHSRCSRFEYSTGYVRTPTCSRKIYYCPIILSYIDRHGNSPNPVVLFRVK